MGQLSVDEEAKVEETGKEKKGRGRPRKVVVPHTLSPEFDGQAHKSYLDLYYTERNEVIALDKIENRIRNADYSINKSIAQTALDIYFVRANWKTSYSRNSAEQFNSWLQKTIPFSRSYVWDLLKCVKELVAYQSGDVKAKELDDPMLASIQQVFNKYDISLLRDVIHLPKTVKEGYIQQLFDPESKLNKAAVKAKKDELKAKVKLPSQNVIVDHVLKVNDNAVLDLNDLTLEDAGLAAEVEKAIERVYRKYKKNENKKLSI